MTSMVSKLRTYELKDLEGMTVKQLLEIAKVVRVTGRHKMCKSQLKANITFWSKHRYELISRRQKEIGDAMSKYKDDYIKNAKVGTIVAFKINEQKMISGKIEEVSEGKFVVQTKNGIRYTVEPKQIAWVKTGSRWPKGVFNELKGGTQNVSGKEETLHSDTNSN